MFDVPILLIIFNRPTLTKIVLQSILSVAPSALFVAADGPRDGNVVDHRKCAETRRLVEEMCADIKIHRKYSAHNLGCGPGPASAISWFFNSVDSGIILEDDCLPDRTFFQFCRELLDYYRHDRKIMHISGNNFLYGKITNDCSYYFSKYSHTWGWATWSRAWDKFDFNLLCEADRSHIWDLQWNRSIQANRGLSIIPNVNLVSNLGFGPTATHTVELEKFLALTAQPMVFPLVHPKNIARDRIAECSAHYRCHHWGTMRFSPLLRTVLNCVRYSIELLPDKIHYPVLKFIEKAYQKKIKPRL